MSKAEKAIVVFIKNPELGKVKTRLARTVGDEKALKIYKSLMAHTRDMVSQSDAQKLLFYSQWINTADEWSGAIFEKHLQAEGDLGFKMSTAFQKAFEQANQVIIVGSDCPGLSDQIIQEAFEALESHDFVIGPALDGGYYLLGMNTFTAEVFENISWSTASVKADTVNIIKGLGKQVKELTALSDIDFEEDWNKYGWELAN